MNIELTLDIASALAIGLLFWQVLLQKKELQLQRKELKNNREELKGQKEATQQLVAINQFQTDLAFAQEVELEMLSALQLYFDSAGNLSQKDSRSQLRYFIKKIVNERSLEASDKMYMQKLYQKLTTIKTDEIRNIYTAEDSIFKKLYDKCIELENL